MREKMFYPINIKNSDFKKAKKEISRIAELIRLGHKTGEVEIFSSVLNQKVGIIENVDPDEGVVAGYKGIDFFLDEPLKEVWFKKPGVVQEICYGQTIDPKDNKTILEVIHRVVI